MCFTYFSRTSSFRVNECTQRNSFLYVVRISIERKYDNDVPVNSFKGRVNHQNSQVYTSFELTHIYTSQRCNKSLDWGSKCRCFSQITKSPRGATINYKSSFVYETHKNSLETTHYQVFAQTYLHNIPICFHQCEDGWEILSKWRFRLLRMVNMMLRRDWRTHTLKIVRPIVN